MDTLGGHLYPFSISRNPKTRKLTINQIPSFKFYPHQESFKQNKQTKKNQNFSSKVLEVMPTVRAKSGNKKASRSKIKPISVSDPKSSTHNLSDQSSIPKLRNSPQICSTNVTSKMPKKKRFFTLVTLRGLGCRGVSSPTTIRPSPEKSRKKKKQSKSTAYSVVKSPGNVVVDVPEVCCTPPKIGFAYDVVPIGKLKTHRELREPSRVAKRTVNLGHASPLAFSFNNGTYFRRTNLSNSMHYHRLSQLPEIIMYHNGSLSERSLNRSDRFGDWRLNLDPMLYEEEYKGNEELGRLACGHYHHIDCIKQWLLLKNQCPLCKTAAIFPK